MHYLQSAKVVKKVIALSLAALLLFFDTGKRLLIAAEQAEYGSQ